MRRQQPVKPASFEEYQYFGLTTGAWPKTNGHAAYVLPDQTPPLGNPVKSGKCFVTFEPIIQLSVSV